MPDRAACTSGRGCSAKTEQRLNAAPALRRTARRLVAWATLALALFGSGGCTFISYLGTDERNLHLGKTFYLGGAGTFGHVGTIDVPKGLREAGYRGAIEVFGWQSFVGGTLRDQMDKWRNEGQARRLANRIQEYLDEYPGRRVNIIALSAGTGIVAWALEDLPEKYHVGTVVFMGSSLSRRYDLVTALSHVDDALYNFYSTQDRILRYGIPIAGSVDREFEGPSVAGLYGFAPPNGGGAQVRKLYDRKVRNMPWRRLYARYGYEGGHTDSTSRAFIARFVAPLTLRPIQPREATPASRPAPPEPSTRPPQATPPPAPEPSATP